jgi:indolepyruvate ferredoxin oxidoreductase alpha subunit
MEHSQTILTGNAAIARGFYEAGGKVAASYPGSPTVEVLEEIKKFPEIYSEFSINEKVALEVAIGGSFAGSRSIAIMKHVGMNIAADPLMTFTQTPVNGGFVLVSGDDPGLASSQNEQDNRIFGKFANMAIVDPSNSQEAKEFTKEALRLSEEFQIPMLLRITSRLCHSRGVVSREPRLEAPGKGLYADRSKYCMIPPASRKAQFFMQERLEKMSAYAATTELNRLELVHGSTTLLVTSGLVYEHVKELNPPCSILKLGLIYPLNADKIRELTSSYQRIIVIEEMMPFIENELRLMGVNCEGKKYFSFTGELDLHDIATGLVQAGVLKETAASALPGAAEVPPRPPLFCSGCPHRPVFDILKKSKVKTVVGDIGCYSLAFLPPFEQSSSIISMGASIGIIKGIKKAQTEAQKKEPLVAVIGDGTFFHSGIPAFINLLHQCEPGENITIIILDNRTTAMTGGQPNAGSGSYQEAGDMHVDITSLLTSAGFARVVTIDQYDYKAAQTAIKEGMAHEGLSIIVAGGACALRYKIVKPHFFVRPEVCIGCKACIKTNCPPLKMKQYDGFEKLKSYIDPDMCVGCGVCAAVCPVGAIRDSSKEEQPHA